MKIIRTLSRLFALLLLAIVIISFPLSLLMRNFGSLLFDPETIKTFVRENVIETDLATNLASRVVQDLLIDGSESDNPASVVIQKGLDVLDEDDWAEISALVAPPALLSEATDTVIDAYVEWLNNDASLPDIKLDLIPWKENLRSNPDRLFIIVLAAVPECSAEELESLLIASLINGEIAPELIPACRPPEPLYSILLSTASSFVASYLEQAPDEIDLNSINASGMDQLILLKENLNRARFIFQWTWVIALGIGTLAVVMAARTVPGALNWAGWSLLFAGVNTLALSQGLGIFSDAVLRRIASVLFEESPLVLSFLLSTLAGEIMEVMRNRLALQGGVILAIALAALVLRRVIPYWQESAGK